ncbi:efflux RND transporter periplasmic adaptor subunit [soil metagenome]
MVRWWLGPSVAGYQIESRALVQSLVATGRVIAVSRAQVGSEITGVVLERRVKEGDRVKPGDILLVLRSDELSAKVREAEAAIAQLQHSARPQAQAALHQAEAQSAQASREAQRRRELFGRQLIAREAMEQAVQAETIARAAAEKARLTAAALASGNSDEAVLLERLASAKATLAKTVVRSEVSGTVLTRNVEPGDLVQPTRVLLDIAREGDTELLVPLDEKNLSVIRLAQPALCVADAFPELPFKASISFIAPSVDPQKGTVDIRLKVEPVPGNLRQDMTVSVTIETGRRAKALVVPNDALASVAGDRATVWSVSNGKVKKIAVRLGLRGLVMTEIVSGLEAGDWVLADLTGNFADGDRVRLKQQSLPADGTDHATAAEIPVNFN